MITGKEQAFAGPSDMGYESGMDIRTWMATQFAAAHIQRSGNPNILDTLKDVDALIAELNKEAKP